MTHRTERSIAEAHYARQVTRLQDSLSHLQRDIYLEDARRTSSRPHQPPTPGSTTRSAASIVKLITTWLYNAPIDTLLNEAADVDSTPLPVPAPEEKEDQDALES